MTNKGICIVCDNTVNNEYLKINWDYLCFDCLDNMNKKEINQIFRLRDQSNLWPVNNQFNVTERAIRKLRKEIKRYGLEYALALDQEISNIVNKVI